MKIPPDILGRDIIKALKVFGYETVRQNGSHIMVTSIKNGEHHLVITNHSPVKVVTLNGIISHVSQLFQLTKEEVLNQLFR